MTFYVFDLDGTIADQTHRQHLIGKDWPAYFKACPGDEPIVAVGDLLATLSRHCIVEIWTGRSDMVRGETQEWLNRQMIDPRLLTRMRPESDHRPDDELKRLWLNEERAKGRCPDMVFEDRSRVVSMWRSEGVACCQVAPGDF